MGEQGPTRFDDVLCDALVAIRAMTTRRDGWEKAPPDERGRAIQLSRGLAGERRFALQTANEALLAKLDALRLSSEAQLRMLEGRTIPGDEELAGRLAGDVAAYESEAHRVDEKSESPPLESKE
jgi:hypothetical protein